MPTNLVTSATNIAVNVVTNTATGALEQADGFLQSLTKLSPQASLVLALVLLGKVLKMVPSIDNRWIPAIIFPAGALGWCAITNWSWIAFIQGHIYGGCAVGIHQFWKLSLGETVSLVLRKIGGSLTAAGDQIGSTTIQRLPPSHHAPGTQPINPPTMPAPAPPTSSNQSSGQP